MKYKLPILSAALVHLVLAASAPGQGRREAPASQAPQQPLAADDARKGPLLMSQAVRQLTAYRALEAKIRHRVDLFGRQLVGAGSYAQLIDRGEILSRLELKLNVAGHPTSTLEVCDGRFLWMRRELPAGPTVLTRVDIGRILEAAGTRPGRVSGAGVSWMAVGGLPRLLEQIQRNFRFGDAAPARIGETPVWVIHGAWLGPAADQLNRPGHAPDRITVTLGRDGLFPLFPYRIVYWKSLDESDDGGKGPPGGKPIVTMEFFEVRARSDFDRSSFAFHPGDREIADLTDLYMKRMGLASAGGGE